MATLRLEELAASNIVAANSLTLKPGQDAYATPVSYADAGEAVNATTTWERVVLEGDRVVGMVRGNFDADSPHEEFRACLWRLNVRGDAQGHGVGRFAVQGLAEEARRRGFDRVTAIWEPGEHGPEAFFLHIGFSPIGETRFGEVLGALTL